MRLPLCVVTILCVGVHSFAALTQIKDGGNKINDRRMLVGALVVLAGVILCFLNSRYDWFIALIGFGCIAYAAVQNGRRYVFHGSVCQGIRSARLDGLSGKRVCSRAAGKEFAADAGGNRCDPPGGADELLRRLCSASGPELNTFHTGSVTMLRASLSPAG